MLKFSHTYLITALLFSSALYASEYKVSFVGTEHISDTTFSDMFINNEGQVFGKFSKGFKGIIFFSDPKKGISTFSEEDVSGYIENISDKPVKKNKKKFDGDNRNLYKFSTRISSYAEGLSFNNHNQMLVHDNSGKACIWSPIQGLRSINVFNSNVHAIALNDSGQVIGIGAYGDSCGQGQGKDWRPFFWDNGVATDMGPGSEFTQKFEILGYHVMSIHLTSLNNKGEITGYFTHGKYNAKQKKYIKMDKRLHFYWNGSINIIPIQTNDDSIDNYDMKLNNTGSVMMRTEYANYIWNIENGLQELHGFNCLDINDSNVIVGKWYNEDEEKESLAIWREGAITKISELLNKDISNLASAYSDSFEVEQIINVVGINNKGQILGIGEVWGEWHPCIIEPIEEQ